MSARRGTPYHDQHGRFTTGGGAAVTSDLAAEQRQAMAARAGTLESGVPGTAARPTPPSTPPVYHSGDGNTAIHLRDGKEPQFEVWRNGELLESVRATRAWRQERKDLIARYDGSPPPPAGADTINSAIRSASGRGAPAPAEGERAELHRLLSEESLFKDPTGDAAAISKRADALAQTWAEYGQQYGGDIFQQELSRARRAAAGRTRAQAVKPSVRQELDLTNLIAENRLAENHAANRDALYRQAREQVRRFSAQGLGKFNELLARESHIWNQREQEQYGAEIEREDYYYPFGDA